MKNKVLALALATGAISTLAGCTDQLFANIWFGFGTALGAIPGNIVGDLLVTTLGL